METETMQRTRTLDVRGLSCPQPALRAEKILMKARFAIKLIPTPRELSSDCGIALRFAWDQADQVKAALTTARVEIDRVHLMERG